MPVFVHQSLLGIRALAKGQSHSLREMIKSELLDLRRKENYEKIKDIILNQNYINKLELFNDFIKSTMKK